MIEYFINGLKMSDVKNIVKANNFSDLEKATEYADSLESSFKSNEILNRKNVPNQGNSRFSQNNNRNYNNQNSSRNSYKILKIKIHPEILVVTHQDILETEITMDTLKTGTKIIRLDILETEILKIMSKRK